MLNPYGTSPIAAIYQGLVTQDGVLIDKAHYNCTVTRIGPGVFLIQMNTGVDDTDFALQCNYFNDEAIDGQNIAYAPNATNVPPFNTFPYTAQIQITTLALGASVDPTGLFNFVVLQCTDGTNETP
jgi:hypothetical protein